MQTNGKTMMTRWFLSWGSLGCHQASPRCVDRSFGGSAANWHHPPSPHIGPHKNPPKSEGSSMTHSTSVALHGSHGVSMVPSQSLLRSTTQSSLRASTETTTKPSRRWQPPRVTGTTGLQLNHLVPLDAISQCNRTRITLTRNWMQPLWAQVS